MPQVRSAPNNSSVRMHESAAASSARQHHNHADMYLHLQPTSQNLVHKQHHHFMHHHNAHHHHHHLITSNQSGANSRASSTSPASQRHQQQFHHHHHHHHHHSSSNSSSSNSSNGSSSSSSNNGNSGCAHQQQHCVSCARLKQLASYAVHKQQENQQQRNDLSDSYLEFHPQQFSLQQSMQARAMQHGEPPPAPPAFSMRPRVNSVSTVQSVFASSAMCNQEQLSPSPMSTVTRSTSFSSLVSSAAFATSSSSQSCATSHRHAEQLFCDQSNYAQRQQQQQQQISAGPYATGNRVITSPALSSSNSSSSGSNAVSFGINLEQYISKRNERERSRVKDVNDAFDNLKNSLPLDIERLTKRMSKVEILRTAIGYIRNLEDVLGHEQHSAAADKLQSRNNNNKFMLTNQTNSAKLRSAQPTQNSSDTGTTTMYLSNEKPMTNQEDESDSSITIHYQSNHGINAISGNFERQPDNNCQSPNDADMYTSLEQKCADWYSKYGEQHFQDSYNN